MDDKQMREAFEATRGPRTDLKRDRAGRYTNPVVQACWDTWQAAVGYGMERAAGIARGWGYDYGGEIADAIRAEIKGANL